MQTWLNVQSEISEWRKIWKMFELIANRWNVMAKFNTFSAIQHGLSDSTTRRLALYIECSSARDMVPSISFRMRVLRCLEFQLVMDVHQIHQNQTRSTKLVLHILQSWLMTQKFQMWTSSCFYFFRSWAQQKGAFQKKVPVVRSCGPDECYGPKSASGLHRAALRHVLRVEVRDAYPLVLRLRSNVIRSAVLLPRRRSDTPVKDVRYLDQRSQILPLPW